MQIDVIYASINILNVKCKRIKETLFNVFVSKKNDYFNVNIMYILKKKRLFSYLYNILKRIKRLKLFEFHFE